MYLSRLVLNPRHRSVRRDLADCHGLHRTIMAAFADLGGTADSARARLAVLFRVEVGEGAAPVVLVQSGGKPDWSCLEPGYLQSRAAWKEIGEMVGRLEVGRRLRFRLRGNPTRTITREGPEGGRWQVRVELHGEEEWLGWLRRKGEQHGFRLLGARAAVQVPDVRCAPRGKVTGARMDGGGAGEKRRLTLFGVEFEGRLEVVERELFLAALRNGIGHGKAYGFGLLSIAPG
jgi:CRISPR system Cascade subunit CasE